MKLNIPIQSETTTTVPVPAPVVSQSKESIKIILPKFNLSLITPLTHTSKTTSLIITIITTTVALIAWQLAVGAGGLIPGPIRVFEALIVLIQTHEFYNSLVSSLVLTAKGMFYSIIIALGFCYIGTIPIFRPTVKFISQCRYLTLTGLVFLFTLLTKDGPTLKISLLLFGIVPFFVTSFCSVIASIKEEEYDLCTTLRYNKWETMYETIIVGRADEVIEVMRQNFAIAWLMITMAEGYSMSQGGLGVAIIKSNKAFDIAQVFAYLLTIFSLGLGFDALLNFIRVWLFPFSKSQRPK